MPRKEYYHNHKEKVLKDNKDYYSKNIEVIKPKQRKLSSNYRKNNKDKVNTVNKKYREEHPEKFHYDKERSYELRLRSKYNLTKEDYDLKLLKQNSKCIICGEDNKGCKLCVDHDHKTGQIRDLLCFRCNRDILGRSGESEDQNKAIELLTNAILYIKKWRRDINNDISPKSSELPNLKTV